MIAHAGAAGHRGRSATERALSEKFFLNTLPDDVGLFVTSCIHCLSTTSGTTVQSPFGHTLHGTKPNSLLQFDYIELGVGATGDKYILLFLEDHSGYSWMYPSVTKSAETASNSILDWCAAFGAPTKLM